MIQIKQQGNRSNSFIELSRVIFLLLLIIGHSGYIMVFSGKPESTFYGFADTRFFLNISSTMTIGFAAITGLYVFNQKSLALRNLSRIFYIIIVNFIIGIIIMLSTGFGVGDGHIMWLLTGSRDSWYLYSILVVYMVAPYIARAFDKREILYLITGLVMLVPMYFTALPAPISGEKSALWLISVAMVTRYLRDKNLKYLFLLVFLAAVSIKAWVSFDPQYSNSWIKGKGFWFTEITGYSDYVTFISLILFLYKLKWQSNTINKIVSNMYFIYEFHYLTQIIFARFLLSDDLHTDFYWSILFSFGICGVFSIGATYIYKRYWIKKVQPKVFNGWEIFMRKIYKP